MKVTLGVVGAGLIWESSHKPLIQKLDHLFDIAAFAVRSEENRVRLQRQFPDANVFQDYRDLLALDSLDAVVVLTPIPINAVVTMAALAAGKHVLVEKPLATSLEDVQRIIRLEGESQKTVLVLEQFRFDDRLSILRRTIDEGHIGEVVSYELVNHGRLDARRNNTGGYGATDWRIDPEFPLGLLFDGGVHRISQLNFLFQCPVSVYATGTSIRNGYGPYDHVLMTLTHPNGIHGTYSFAGYLDDTQNHFHIRGTRGTIEFRRDDLVVQGEAEFRVGFPDSDRSLVMWKTYGAWFADPTTPIYGTEESRIDISTLLAVDESIRHDRPVVPV